MKNFLQNKLLVCDLDGTLLDKNGEIDQESLILIKTFCKDGGNFVVCTGRMDTDIQYVERKLGFQSSYRISQNGAVIRDKNNQILSFEKIPRQYVAQLNEIIFGMNLRTEVNNLTNRLFPSPRAPGSVAEFVDSSIIIKNLADFVLNKEKNPTIYLTFGNKEQFTIIRQKIYNILGKNAVKVVETSPTSLEVFSTKASKGTATGLIMEQLRLSADNVYVAGDAESDVAMFAYAKHSFAVEQADSFVREQADAYVSSVGEIVKIIYKEHSNVNSTLRST